MTRPPSTGPVLRRTPGLRQVQWCHPGLSGGAEKYGHRLQAFTSLELLPEQVHRIGLDQVARLEAEYLQIAAPVLGTSSLAEIYSRLRDDPELHYRDADTLVADASHALARATAATDAWFGVAPVASCTANPTTHGALAFYSPPSWEGTTGGAFFFNVADPMVWGTFQLEAVTFHEGVPGHHFQIALAQELPDLHPILAEYLVAAYSEGWGLYTKRLADEMGLYSSELDRIGMLSADSMRALSAKSTATSAIPVRRVPTCWGASRSRTSGRTRRRA